MHSYPSDRRAPCCRWWQALALALFIGLSATGCVQRRLTIRSNPPGARVFVGDEEIGTTPTSTDFVYYGTRKIRLVKDGYETLVVNQPIPAPWYQIPPIDFVTENLVPGEIRDERVVNFQLMPLQEAPTQQLLSRAEQLRSSSGARPVSAIAAPVPATVSPGGSPAIGVPIQSPAVFPPPAAAPPSAGPAVPPPYNPPQYLPPG